MFGESLKRRAKRISSNTTILLFALILLALLSTPLAYPSGDDKEKLPPIVIKSSKLEITKGTLRIYEEVIGTWGDFILKTHELKAEPGKVSFPSGGILTHSPTHTTIKFGYGEITEERATFKDATIIVQGIEPLQGKLYIYSDEISIGFNNRILLGSSKFTTCSRKPPHWHYHLEAERGEVKLNDEAVFYNVKGYLGKWGLVRRGRLRISLKKDKKSDSESILPKIGYNRAEGWFVEKEFSYWFNDDNYGKVRARWAELLGTTVGIRHYYKLPNDKGNVDIFHQGLYGRKTGSRNDQTSITFNLRPLRGVSLTYRKSLYAFVSPTYVSPKQSSENLRISYSVQPLSITYSRGKSSTEGVYENTTDNWNVNYSKGPIKFRYSYNSNTNNYLSTNNIRNSSKLQANLTYDIDDYTLEALWEITKGQITYLDKSPLIQIKPKGTMKILGVPISGRLLYGKYIDKSENLITKRYSIQAKYSSPTWGKDNFNLRFSSWFQQDFYDTGSFYYDRNWHARYVIAGNLSARYNLGKLSTSVTLDYLTQKGFNPLYLDSFADRRSLSLNLTYQDTKWDLTISTTYDLLRPSSGNIYYLTLNYKPSRRFSLKLASSFNPRYNTWSYISIYADALLFSDTLRAQIWTTYDPNTNKLNYLDLALVKDMHCYYIGLVYRQSARALFLTVSLKALPSVSAGLGWNQFGPYIPGIPFGGGTSMNFGI